MSSSAVERSNAIHQDSKYMTSHLFKLKRARSALLLAGCCRSERWEDSALCAECFLLCLLPFRCVVRRDKVIKMHCSHYFQISNLKHSRLAYITWNYYHHQPVINALHYNYIYIKTAMLSLVGDRKWVSLYYYGSSSRMCGLSLTERCTSLCVCFTMLW